MQHACLTFRRAEKLGPNLLGKRPRRLPVRCFASACTVFSEPKAESRPLANSFRSRYTFLDPPYSHRRYSSKPRVVIDPGVDEGLRTLPTPDSKSTEIFIKMRAQLEFITAPSADTQGTAFVMNFFTKRYFFGQMHEGLSRAGLQQGAKFLKCHNFFLTGRTSWATSGGLLGMILSVADGAKAAAATRAEGNKAKMERRKQFEDEQRVLAESGKAGQKLPRMAHPSKYEVDEDVSLKFWSGPNLKQLMACARSFIFRQGIPIQIQEFDAESVVESGETERKPDFEDEHIKVWQVPLSCTPRPSSSSSQTTDSAKKRSHDEFVEGQQPPHELNGSVATALAQGEDVSRSAVADFVLKEMFQSEWRYDRLTEKWLSEVTMPAKIFVRDPQTQEIRSYRGPFPGHSGEVPDVRVLVREPWPGALVENLPPTTPSTVSISYIVKTHKQRGKFRPKEALRLGVPRGRAFTQLVDGESVEVEDGSIVTPEMVMEPSKEGGGFIVADLPTPDYIFAFLDRPEFSDPSWMNGVQNVLWLLGPGVFKHEKFGSCLDLCKNLQNIISSPDTTHNHPAMISAAKSFFIHHHVDPERYPFLQGSHLAPVTPGPVELPAKQDGPADIITQAGLKLEIVPVSKIVQTNVVPEIMLADALENFPDALNELVKQTRTELMIADKDVDRAELDNPGSDAEITTLGTGSMLPSLYRNVSANLIRVPGVGSYILDCGENTLGQLKRVYSKDELDEIFRDLRMIWISHLHADHHLGTLSVIRAWAEAVHGTHSTLEDSTELKHDQTNPTPSDDRKLIIVSNEQMERFLREYSSVEPYGYEHIISLSCTPEPDLHENTSPLLYRNHEVGFHAANPHPILAPQIQAMTGLSSLRYARVKHCWGAYAVVLTFHSGFKISYSGDCRPSAQFAKIGKGSTVLIHEATFDDQLKGEAQMKKHSTTGEAISVGAVMGAKNVLLTHFSQRYAKMPVIEVDERALKGQVLEDAEAEDEDMDAPVDNLAHDEGEAADEKLSGGSEQGSSSSHRPHDHPDDTVASPTKMHIGIAFDYMRVKVRDIQHLQRFNHIFQELYAEDALRPPAMEPGQGKEHEVPAKFKHQPKKVKNKRRSGSMEAAGSTMKEPRKLLSE